MSGMANIEAPERANRERLMPFMVVGGLAALMWLVELIDLIPGVDLDQWGIQPRTLSGLIGVVTAPFLHDGIGHLLSNTIVFLVLGCIIAASGTVRFVQVTVIVMAVSGLGTWLLAPSGTITIGASGLVFGYLTYLLARGLFEVRVTYLVVALGVLVLYGGVLWGLLPRPGISWQAHVMGAIGGVLAARLVHSDRPAGSEPAPAPI